jgi:hypothetical protein
MKPSESGGIAPPFLTSSLDEGEWSASRPGRLTPSAHWIEGCWEEQNFVPSGNRTLPVQPVAGRYTDLAVRTLQINVYKVFIWKC